MFFFYNKSNVCGIEGGGGTLSFISLFTDFFSAQASESNQNATLKLFDFSTKVDGLPACKLPIR